MTNNAFTRPLSGAGILAATCFVGFVMFLTSIVTREPAPPDTAREIVREQFMEQRRAQRRIVQREAEASVALYCKHYGEKSVACRDMRVAAGIER